MEPMKTCPQCGKPVAADRTYCMNCGVTLGVRCPDCRAVLPVGAKVCSGCGHSFVKKKKGLDIPLWREMKRHARSILATLAIVLLVFTLVAAAFPAAGLRVTVAGDKPKPSAGGKPEAEFALIEHEITGYELMLYFLSGEPESITTVMELRELKDDTAVLKLLLYVGGIGWLGLLCGALLAILLLACNLRRIGRQTVRRLYLPFGLSLGGGALLFVASAVIGPLLKRALPVEDSEKTASMITDTLWLWPLLALLAAVVAFALEALLYIGKYRREEANEHELSLSEILSIPLAGLISLLRRGWRRLRRLTKKGKTRVERDEPLLAVTPRFTTFLVLLAVSLVFTQALLSKISHIFFWFMFLLPIVLLIYVLLARLTLSVDMLSSTVTTEKNTPYTYEFRINNRSPLALPFIEAQLSIPQSNSVRCTERTVRLSMAPMTAYHMKNTVSFRFRGTYEIGVRCFYIYDFFRLFRARVDVESIVTVYVLPRRLALDDTLAQAISDSTARTVRSPLVVDRLEVSDIRDYQNGDSLKSIHWKLSSKSETFVVKDYNTGTANQTVVFCDLDRHFPDEPPTARTLEPAAEESATPAERLKQSREEKLTAKQQKRQASDLRAKSKRVVQDRDTHAISDEELQKRLDTRAAAAGISDSKTTAPKTASAAPTSAEAAPALDVHELASPMYYEDMNEYLADGVVELSIAMVLAELRQGHEVLLVWFDRRSDTGVYAYPLRGVDEFETIYHLFATAPLCEPERPDGTSSKDVTTLTAMASHLQSVKQLFVISTMDSAMLSALSALPGAADSGNAGAAEVVLYSPEERFKHPVRRASYLEGCREQLAGHGITLTAGSFNITRPATTAEGGMSHEA